ncbi:DNA polymerase [Devosia enhydra]|uniref:Type-4 uracil-DNA glycosylase n=2 Tax=Devosia enhydra TaxID=665118 RepID=A0A1K2I2V3_9HYPH|nr:uracil-DNA glycosylase [Devosia enhydra]SFZ86092.1 DNA polymerase [Devosia enhydra]
MMANRPLNPAELHAVLEWYRAAGVDVAVGDEPVDRFAASLRQKPQPKDAAPGLARPAVAAPAPAVPMAPMQVPLIGGDPREAEALANAADSLDALKAAMAGFDGCSLKARATQLVFADGNPDAGIMLIGEAPGSEEDKIGKPFVGRAGQLLDRMLGAIGLDRNKVFIANMVPWRPPGNRNPTPEELAVCLPFLHRMVALAAPRVVVTLGNVPTQALFETSVGITRIRGQWKELTLGGHSVRAMATLHPAFLLRTPSAKRQAWQDLLSVREALQKENLLPG